jgi:hypothetical protein
MSDVSCVRTHPPHPPIVRERTSGLGVTAHAHTWRIDLKDVGGAQPADVRLRQWLKLGLRAFGLRCESIRSNHTHAEACGPRPRRGIVGR